MVLGEAVTATVLRRSEGKLGRAASACMQAGWRGFSGSCLCVLFGRTIWRQTEISGLVLASKAYVAWLPVHKPNTRR